MFASEALIGAGMKKLLVLLTIGLTLLPSPSPGAQTAQARLVCLSLRFQQGAANDMFGFRWTMDMTTLDAGINGELAPGFWGPAYTNGAWVELYEELGGETFQGRIVLDSPDFTDANGNGFADFYEISQAVASLPALGAYNITGFGSGGFTASWYRDAGSALGSCTYTIPNPFGGNMFFYHWFELIEYTGELSYTPGSNTVPGSMSLTNTNSMSVLEGPVEFTKSATNRFNQLTLKSVLWTNASQQVLDLYTNTTFLRRTGHRTNYYGNVEFNDGDLNTPGPGYEDYYTWHLSLDDLNDADHDGIPDFSDDPAGVAPPRRPQLLSLAKGPTNLLLSISGDVGRLHHVLETTELATGNWVTNLSLTLTNDPQVVSLPLPPGGAKFWRALAQ
jgi:hypothetical protein